MEIIITTLIIIINMALTKAEPLNFIGNPNQRRCMAKLVTDSKLMGEADFPEIIGATELTQERWKWRKYWSQTKFPMAMDATDQI
jgi:hypothetical protein